ncbi:hypothetical protein OG782_35960 [Streptomyces sp. NBC_00876]|uniref:hypothetical protein n=1 Tax=Streptomyces sp. NBC_00876 TaxID=2975853 RepID=UPI00386CAC3E|nr:hypothetical protein OG782_35960 [Streptomyces sp. NBC_00876]
MRSGMERLGWGEASGDYAIAGVGGALAQVARRTLLALCLVTLVLLAVKQPPAALTKGAVTLTVALAVVGLTWAWGRAGARFGLRRCYLFNDGLVVTGLFGRARAMAWTEVTALKVMGSQSLFMAFYRFEFERRGAGRVAFLAMGHQPALAELLLSRAAVNGVR